MKSNLINKTSKIWFGAFFILAATILAQIIITGMYAGKGIEWTGFRIKADQLARENQQLKEGLAQKTSLQEVSTKAETLGFVRPTSVEYVDFSNSVALLPQ